MATPSDQRKQARTRLGSVEPMLARTVASFPSGKPGTWVYEPKLDGFRCLAFVDTDRGVHLQSRRGARFNEIFPEIAWAVYQHLPARTIVDGEIVRWSSSGKLDFPALHRRNVAGRRRAADLARTESCHYVIFDLVRLHGQDVTALPLSERRALLKELFAPIPAAGVLALGMQTTCEAEARAWYESLHRVGVEGLVIKPVRSLYETGVRGWFKLKHKTSAECVIGGYVGRATRPSGLILGRHDQTGRLRVVGRTTHLPTAAAVELAPLLIPAAGEHPWPATLPPGWAGSPYGQDGPISYTRVEPVVVVEVLADTAVDAGRHRHPLKYLRPRIDLDPVQVIEERGVGA